MVSCHKNEHICSEVKVVPILCVCVLLLFVEVFEVCLFCFVLFFEFTHVNSTLCYVCFVMQAILVIVTLERILDEKQHSSKMMEIMFLDCGDFEPIVPSCKVHIDESVPRSQYNYTTLVKGLFHSPDRHMIKKVYQKVCAQH